MAARISEEAGMGLDSVDSVTRPAGAAPVVDASECPVWPGSAGEVKAGGDHQEMYGWGRERGNQ